VPVGWTVVIDLRLLREDPDLIRASQRVRGESTEPVETLLRADEDRRAATQRFEAVRAEQKSLGKQVAKASGAERAARCRLVQCAARRTGRAAAGRRPSATVHVPLSRVGGS